MEHHERVSITAPTHNEAGFCFELGARHDGDPGCHSCKPNALPRCYPSNLLEVQESWIFRSFPAILDIIFQNGMCIKFTFVYLRVFACGYSLAGACWHMRALAGAYWPLLALTGACGRGVVLRVSHLSYMHCNIRSQTSSEQSGNSMHHADHKCIRGFICFYIMLYKRFLRTFEKLSEVITQIVDISKTITIFVYG